MSGWHFYPLSPSHLDAADAEDGDEGAEEDEAGHGEDGDLDGAQGGLLVAASQCDVLDAEGGQGEAGEAHGELLVRERSIRGQVEVN